MIQDPTPGAQWAFSVNGLHRSDFRPTNKFITGLQYNMAFLVKLIKIRCGVIFHQIYAVDQGAITRTRLERVFEELI
jgi:hypothetical protein